MLMLMEHFHMKNFKHSTRAEDINIRQKILKNFGMNHLFNNDLCKTIEGDLISAYESFGITEPLPFRTQETLEDNNSLRILRDIFDECAE